MRNKQIATILGVLSWCLVFPVCLQAQTPDALRARFPNEKAVLLNRILEYTIDVRDNQPKVESHETEQIEYLLSGAAAYMGEFGFAQSDLQQVKSYEAYTITPDNKKLKVTDFKTSIDKESFVFYDDVKQTNFNFPAVEPGAVGNLLVSYNNTDPHLLSSYYFTGGIPAINSELKLNVSKDVSLKYQLMGIDTTYFKVNIESKHHYNVYTFTYKSCPADKHYEDAPGYAWYSPHVVFYIENYKDNSGNTISYLSNADDLYKLSYGYLKSINQTISPELKHIVDSLTGDLTSQEAKAKRIYSWVQNNIKYVAFEDGMGGFIPRDAGLVCSRRFGDCKDMASILTEMNTAAGITAYFTWIGTRDLPYTFSQTPLPLVSNHMICTINLNGKYIFLDGTDPTCVFGVTPSAIQDKEAMISVNNKEYKILKVPIINKEDNGIVDSTWLELTPTGIKGTIKKTMTGYMAMNFYGELMYWPASAMDENMKGEFARGSNKFKLDDFHVDKKPVMNQVALSANFELPDYAKKVGDDYYLNLNLFKIFANEKIDYPQRKTPIEYDCKYIKKYVTLLKIPDGYKLGALPLGKEYHNKVWGFNIQYQQKGNWIILTQEFDNENLMLTNDQFDQWNTVLKNLVPLYKQSLNLTKI
jgi:hypothetical protein